MIQQDVDISSPSSQLIYSLKLNEHTISALKNADNPSISFTDNTRGMLHISDTEQHPFSIMKEEKKVKDFINILCLF